MKTLKLEKRGCDFWADEPVKSDINNYRVCLADEAIEGKNGKEYFLEFSLWRNRGYHRTTNKRNGQPLKKPVFEVVTPNGLHCSISYNTKDGNTYADLKLEEEIRTKNYTYTTKNILKIVNTISKHKYNKVIFV